MHPILFRVGSFPIHVYSLTFAAGIILCAGLSVRRAEFEKLNADRMLQGLFVGIIAIFFASKAMDIAVNWRTYRLDPASLTKIGYGHVFYGGYLGAVIFASLFYRIAKQPVLRFLDIAATYMPLGLALHRAVGCFCAGCCFGRPTTLPWGVRFPPAAPATATFGPVPVHPTQLYEAAAVLLMFPALLAWRRLPRRQPGELIALQIAWYAVARFAIEFVRGDDDRGQYGPLSTSQWIGVGMLLVAGGLALNAWRLRRAAAMPAAETPA
jgi:phosphatidylglycerol:prolipoprotein diacylglycerol transferase